MRGLWCRRALSCSAWAGEKAARSVWGREERRDREARPWALKACRASLASAGEDNLGGPERKGIGGAQAGGQLLALRFGEGAD